jgi:heptosyltransferase-1
MKSFLVIRPSAIGDVVMASPMIRVLRKAYPKAKIVWLAEPAVVDLLKADPDLDRVIIWPKSQWRTWLLQGRLIAFWRDMLRLRRELRQERFDLALDGVGLLKSRFLARLSGAREKVGFESKEPGRWLMTRVIGKGPRSDRMSSEYRFLMEHLGLPPGDFHPRIFVSDQDRQAAGEILKKCGLYGRYAVLCPFTTRPQKHWFEDRWAALSRRVEADLGLPVAILGGPGDREGSRRICALGGNDIRDLTGKASLSQAAAIIQNCSLLIGVDTGLTHMGTAFDRPTLALFGATCPYRLTANPLTRVLYEKLPCSPCRRSPTCDNQYPCMQAHTVEKVLGVARDLLQQGRTKS